MCVENGGSGGGGEKRINMAISLGEDQDVHFALKSAAEKQMKRFVRMFRVAFSLK